MASDDRLDKWAPHALVLAPPLCLSAIFAVAIYLLVGSQVLSGSQRYTLLYLTAFAYLLAIGFIISAGFAKVKRLEQFGETDSLTGLGNRRKLHRDFEDQKFEGEEYAIAIVDLDGFKVVNDHYSHQVGDKVITQCARILTSICGNDAQCYRLGGDEFALAMTGPLAGTIVEGMARSLLERLTMPVEVEDRRLSLGASVGLARKGEGDPIDSSELMRRADVALYASKNSGRMRCTWYSDRLDQHREDIKQLDNELREALAQNRFELHYQPLVDATTARIVAVECLLRLDGVDGKPVSPARFIPVAEDSGFINAIGLWVLQRACSDAKDWPDITVSINISAAQLRNPEFPIELGHVLESTGFPPERLELEITETSLVTDLALAERILDVVRGFGVHIALDDFGTGYASIGFLRQFRFEKLKLDRSLVVMAGTDTASRAMMLSSITVARAMQMGVTAEGVETEEQAAMVRAAGCDQIQGWLYYRAVPAGEISKLLQLQSEKQETMPIQNERKSA